MKTLIPIIFIIVILGLSYVGEEKPKPKCKYTGMDKIEYGLWVTNCGDTVRLREKRDYNKIYYDQNKE